MMSQDTSAPLEQLASTISSAASLVTKYLRDNSHPQPSFAADGPSDFPATAPADVNAARIELLTAARQLQFLASWPAEAVKWNIASIYHDVSSIRWLYHFNIFAAVPGDKPISYTDLAIATGLEEDRLTRIIRQAMTNHLFLEPKPGFVAHSASSAVLAKEKLQRAFVGHFTEDVFPASAKLVEATEKFGHSKAKNHTAFNIAFDTDLDAMAFVGRDPVRSERFADCMKSMVFSQPWNISHVVDGYDWEGLGKAVIVDVGGSVGHVSKAIASNAPELSFVIQDQAEVITQGKAEIGDLASRFTFSVHDFFTPNPLKQGEVDVFFMRCILHDWPAAEAIAILKNLVPSMIPDQTKIVIFDAVVPGPGEIACWDERLMRLSDLQMMTALNAGERSVADWEALADDAGLRIVNRSTPRGSTLSMIELMLV